MYKLRDANNREYLSETPGALGGNKGTKRYGRLDCPTARRYLAKGTYQKSRVFFADEATARAAGYQPCSRCMPAEYAAWKASQ